MSETMNINRHNYEEFFLLYMDDELTAEQRKGVEAFVQQHPDLADEFEMLQFTKLSPEEEVVFENKEMLFNIPKTTIDLDNYEEYLLLKLDNELSEDELKKTDEFLLKHEEIKKQYELLQQTKLPEETIEFRNKKVLYRSEETERRVVPFRFVRFAAAAAVVGIAALVWFMIPSNTQKGSSGSVAKVQKISPKQTREKIDSVVTQPVTQSATQQQVAIVPKVYEKKQDAAKENIKLKHSEESIKTPESDNVQIAVQQQKNRNNLPELNSGKQELQEPPLIAKSDVAKTSTANLKPLEEINKDEVKMQTANYVADTKNTLTKPAVYKEIDTNDDNDPSVYVGSIQLDKNKVNRLLKRAAHIFGNKVKDANSDGKLQVASFEIDTNKSK